MDMKLVEQYLYAIGQHLPLKGRQDILSELRSLLLDEIENREHTRPGENPTKSVIEGCGSPREVARRYAGHSHVIAPGLTDLYFFILKLMALGLGIAFTAIFAIILFTEAPQGIDLLKAVLSIPARTASALLGGIGGLTIAFILISRYVEDPKAALDEDWTAAELKGIQVEQEAASIPGAVAGIFFTIVLIVLLNVRPEILTAAERSFSLALPLGHAIDIDRFRFYVYFITALWFLDILRNLLVIRFRQEYLLSKALTFLSSLLSIALFSIMLSDNSLYVYDQGWIGFKLIFAIIVLVSIAELLGSVYRFLKGRLAGRL